MSGTGVLELGWAIEAKRYALGAGSWALGAGHWVLSVGLSKKK